MRLITYIQKGAQRLGAWINGDRQIVDLQAASEASGGKDNAAFASMQALIEAGPAAWDRARELVAAAPSSSLVKTADVSIAAPLPTPIQIRDCLCFPGHLLGIARNRGEKMIAEAADPDRKRAELEQAGFFELAKSYYERPVYYTSNRFVVHGPDVDVVWPTYSTFIDYELEWSAIIGVGGINIAKEDARSHIFGYTIFNDWSARDEQMLAMGGAVNIGPGAGKDFANGMGPCIVTADEIPDPYSLTMKARVNGVETSSGSSSGMHFRFEDLIASLTRAHALYPGEVICSGTVGTGCALETGKMISPGDVIELEIEKIGVLRNRVLAPHMSGPSKMFVEA